jgi:hypothetical protein
LTSLLLPTTGSKAAHLNSIRLLFIFFTAETAEVAEKTLLILNLSGIGVLCG